MARFIDILMGEEHTDHTYIDISKVQLLFFTLAAWAIYIYLLWIESFGMPLAFPEISDSIAILLGISNGGYVAVKATPKTKPDTP